MNFLIRPFFFFYLLSVASCKIFLKLLLGNNSNLYKSFLYPLGLVRHGHMESVQYTISLFEYFTGLFSTYCTKPFLSRESNMLEIGPGDNLGLPFLFSLKYSLSAYAIDHANFSHQVSLPYLEGISESINHESSSQQLISSYSSVSYLTHSYHSFAKLKNLKFDLIISNAAFEHIPLSDVPKYFECISSSLSPSGIALLQIDLKDHLVGDFFHTLFPCCFWESSFNRSGLHYTNRLLPSQYIDLASKANLNVVAKVDTKLVYNSFFTMNNKVTFHSLFSGVQRPSSFLLVLSK